MTYVGVANVMRFIIGGGLVMYLQLRTSEHTDS